MYIQEIDELYNKIFNQISKLNNIDFSMFIDLKYLIDSRSTLLQEQQDIITRLKMQLDGLVSELDSADIIINDLE